MQFANRLTHLGTESAFAVSHQASEWRARGNEVFPFHLGDLNISTPDNIVTAMNKAIKEGKTGYSPPPGIPELRAVLADDVGKRRGVSFDTDNVVIQPGGKPVIGKFLLALMNPGDEVMYPTPGFPIYESQIEFHGGVAVPYVYREAGDGFIIDLDEIESKITSKTRLFIYNNYQNPTGAESSEEEMKALAEIAIKYNLWVLSDEAYFEIRYRGKSRSIVSFPGMEERTVILYTFSKKYAMTGWRMGAAIGPKKVARIFSELNVNDESCTNHFIQYAMIEALTGSQKGPVEILSLLRKRRDATALMIKRIDGIHLSVPDTTFYLFPNITNVVKRKNFKNISDFQSDVLKKTGVAFCTRNHFGRPLPGETEYYIRVAYSGINREDIKKGLSRFRDYCEN